MFGTTNNPWALTHTSGGSSGGAAAAVACGMTSFELGTDIGGSVRVPSAFCGVWGHKPSFGIIPTLGYLDEPGGGGTESDVNVFGPIARSAADLRLLVDVLAQPTPERSPAWSLRLPEPTVTSLRGLRVAVWFDEPELEVDSRMSSVLRAAAAAVESAGAVVDSAARPEIEVRTAWRNGARLIGAATSVSDDGGPLTHHQWMVMDRLRARARAAWAQFFTDFDVLLCPVAIVTAFPHLQEGLWSNRRITVNGRERDYVEIEGWPALIGSVYLPSTSVPVGRTAEGLPVGMQVVAPFLQDRTALLVGDWIGEIVGGYQPPPVFT